jgi:hypothetical protein
MVVGIALNRRAKLIVLWSLVVIILIPIAWVVLFKLWLLEVEMVVTPASITAGTISVTIGRIEEYAQENKTVPKSLSKLPIRPGHSNKTTDAWGKKLIYLVNENERTISIISYGKDEKGGGAGEDKDIIRSYYYLKPDGSLWIGSDDWFEKARIKDKE